VRRRPWLLIVLCALVLALLGLAVSLAIVSPTAVGLAFTTLPVAAVGLVIARRQPGNRIGLLLLGSSVVFLLYGVAEGYSVWDYYFHGGTLPVGPAAVVIASELWSAIFLILPLAVLLFPDGKLPSRWRMILRAYLAVSALIIGILLASGAWQVSSAPIVVDGQGQLVNNPPAPPGVPPIAIIILAAAVPVFWVSFVVRQVLSWRRANGERRAQLKWLLAGSAASVIGLVGTFLFAHVSGLLATVLDAVMVGVATFSLPLCISFAILKYHLYDIDRLISRTLSYALVTGLLAGAYAGLVLLATEVFRFHSTVAVAASTLVVAALFNPLRRRVQHAIDQRFNRARYDADRTAAAFAARLKDEVDLDSIRDDLAGAVQQALEPAHVSVWINERG